MWAVDILRYMYTIDELWASWPRGYKTGVHLKLKIKRNDWLLADTCPQAANHCALFELF